MNSSLGAKDEYNPFAERLSRYRAALSRLEIYGLRVVPSSRLRVYAKRLELVTNDPSPYVDLALANQLTFDLREIDELIEIVDSLPESPRPAELERLRLIQKGHEHPDASTADKGRDAQYELYLRAVLLKGGLQVEVQEPDLVVEHAGQALHIAAKRPTSLPRMDDRLRDAIDQLEKLSPPGIVAISLDRVIRPPNGLLAVPTLGKLQQAMIDVTELFRYENAAWMVRRVANRRIAALLLTTRIPGRTLDTNHSVLGTSIHVEVLTAPGSPEHLPIMAVADGLSRYLE